MNSRQNQVESGAGEGRTLRSPVGCRWLRSAAPFLAPAGLVVAVLVGFYPFYNNGGFITTRWGSHSGAHFRTPGQMLAELRDMRAHGITNFEVTEWIDGDRPDGKHFDFRHLDRVMDLRDQAGFPVRRLPLYWSGGPNMLTQFYKHDPWMIDADRLRKIERTVRALMKWARGRKIPEVFIWGVDELDERKLRSELRAFRLIRGLGAKIAMTANPRFHDYVGDLVDVINTQGEPKDIPAKACRRLHTHGGKIYNYARPQTGVCQPLAYRRNYGVDLYLTELDGPWPYGYMAMSGRYQAYDRIHTTHGRWLNHPFSYPTTNGVIPTWGSQGWRAAADDVRYFTTLQNLLDADEGSKQARARTKAFLKSLSPDTDLDTQRRRCARLILSMNR